MSSATDAPITVVKLGGRTQSAPSLPAALASLWHRTGKRLVIVHGGGDQISAMQRARGEEPAFVGGRRVSTPLVLELVRMVLSGSANKQLVSALTAAGVSAVGMSGEDAVTLPASILDQQRFGAVGKPERASAALPLHLLNGGFLPVISPVGTNDSDSARGALNVNGDDAAAAIAVALGAAELLLMVDVAGVLDANTQLIAQLTLHQTHDLVTSGVAAGGMAAKLEACEIALSGGVFARARWRHYRVTVGFSRHGHRSVTTRHPLFASSSTNNALPAVPSQSVFARIFSVSRFSRISQPAHDRHADDSSCHATKRCHVRTNRTCFFAHHRRCSSGHCGHVQATEAAVCARRGRAHDR